MKDLFTQIATYLSEDRAAYVRRAYEYAARAHEGQMRLTGEPYIVHPVETASYLAELHLDAITLAAALLHDVMEDCGVTFQQIEEEFGADVARLVDGVTKLNKLDLATNDGAKAAARPSEDTDHAASLRKMLVAMAQDLRVVLIKLADRLHNMRTLQAHTPERRRAIAQETLDIYAPLAHRLGMWDLKWRLEDMSFHHLEPARYKEISRLLARRRDERERYIANVRDILSQALRKEGIKAQVTGRAKHIYSVYGKMQAYAAQGKDFDDIHDLFALRVKVKDRKECYVALSVVHDLWDPLPGQMDDYVAKPKENGYQSLHTAVMGPDAMPLEVQIRTDEMHQVAEHGIAAHWRYKEGVGQDNIFEREMTWLRRLLEWQQEETGAEEFLENVKTDLLPDQVFVYTPKGDIKELPAGSTSIDFAYHVHTELGHRCMGAKVNGKLVPLDHQLKNGDTVEILTSKVARGPSLDWLNTNAGYVHSATARERIRAWFRKQERGANIQRGRDLLTRELRRLSLNPAEEELAKLFRMDAVDDFLAALGSGGVTINQLVTRLTQHHEAKMPPTEYHAPAVGPASGVEVLGVGDLLTSLAKCCSPLPGDAIVGFITRTRGISVHRRDCRNIVNEDEPERLIRVDWGSTKTLLPVRIALDAWDRVGLLRDITTVVSGEKINIASLVTQENDDGTATIQLTVFTTGVDQLSRLFTKLEEIQGVTYVTRAATNVSNGNRPGALAEMASGAEANRKG
ncbi:MAG: bifunctional (p)ppGpp synthetase/guanosine-3',5'-bis(diphosphate) 3'-pyrophosphohydrolase [Chloroflexi bacterium]|nr:bifunctional (p)ppGpp synthetase/guanosine-3',5'-bis(diphosphate) 3'-pyrophosphohydrolase [Chloroflexota bacterium]